MQIYPGDRIYYNVNHFEPAVKAVTKVAAVVKVASYDTGAGTYEEYLTEDGEWVSEMQLSHESPLGNIIDVYV